MTERARRARLGLSRVAAFLLGAALLLSACVSTVPKTLGRDVRLQSTAPGSLPAVGAPAPPLPSPAPLTAVDVSNDPIVSVVKKVAPAVVNVTTATVNPNSIFGGSDTSKAVGTGFIIRSDGVLVTNFHVVEGALNIKVTLPPPDGRSFEGRVIGGDSDHDLAVVKIDGEGLPTVALGNSSSLVLGERVIALGYALALPGGPTVTSGIISSLARTVQVQDPEGNNGQGLTRTLEDALQTDAAINPGNSGGPLVDLAGNVVAINSAGAGSAENIGFSIAIDPAKLFIEKAMEHPSAPVGYMGVSTTTVDKGVAAQLDLPVNHGVLIVSISPGGPTSKTAAKVGDVIVGFDGKPIETSDDLSAAILDRNPGDEVTVQLVAQDGRRYSVTLTLGVRPLPAP
jgi:serine protease Do